MATDVDEFLAHYGVPGMKWGQRRAHAKEMRSLDKASKKKDKAERSDKIDAARDRFRSGQARAEYKQAKAEYKAQKNVIGKREAKKILNEVKEKNLADYETGQQYKNGKEIAGAIALGVAGSILISALASRS